MQDNPFDKQFMDGAWSQMQKTLDQEMPRKKRRVVWWVFLPLFGIALAILAALWVDRLQPPWYVADEMTPAAVGGSSADKSISVRWWAVPPGEQLAFSEGVDWWIPFKGEGSEDSEEENNPGTISTNSFLNFTQTKISLNTKNGKKINPTTHNKSSENQHSNAPEVGEEPIAFLPARPVSLLPEKLLLQNWNFGFMDSISGANEPASIDPVSPSKTQWWIEGEGALFTSYSGDQYATSGGILGRKPMGKFSLEMGLNIYTGKALLSSANRGAQADFSQAEEMDTPNPGTNFVGNPNIDNRLRAGFGGLSLPLGVNYHFKERWGLFLGADFNYLIQLRARNALNSNTYQLLTNREISATAEARPADLYAALRSPVFLEPRLGVSWQPASRWLLRGSFVLGHHDLLKSESYQWRRDRITLELQYRLGK